MRNTTGADPHFAAPRGDDTWVVVPMFNEAHTIAGVVASLLDSFSQVVCVDDGSRDDSAIQASSAGACVVRHPVNLGQGASLQTGIEFALRSPRTRFVVTFDGDGQHRVVDAVAMLEAARASGADIVLGSRFLQGHASAIPIARRLTLRAALAFTRLTTGLHLSDVHNGLRVFNRQTANQMNLRLHRMAHASEILSLVSKRGLKYREHPVNVCYTEYSQRKGQSNLNAINIAFDLLLHRLRTAP